MVLYCRWMTWTDEVALPFLYSWLIFHALRSLTCLNFIPESLFWSEKTFSQRFTFVVLSTCVLKTSSTSCLTMNLHTLAVNFHTTPTIHCIFIKYGSSDVPLHLTVQTNNTQTNWITGVLLYPFIWLNYRVLSFDNCNAWKIKENETG